LDNAAKSSRLTTGGSSGTCSQPTGGDDGGDIRKALSFSGGCKVALEFFNFIGLNLNMNKLCLITFLNFSSIELNSKKIA
jgi:hypothetical protein